MLFRNWGYKHKNNKGGGSEAPQALQYWKCNSQVNSILLWKSFSPGDILTNVLHRKKIKNHEICPTFFWMITIINHTTYLVLEPKTSVCSLTNLPLLVKKNLLVMLVLPFFFSSLVWSSTSNNLFSLAVCFFSPSTRAVIRRGHPPWAVNERLKHCWRSFIGICVSVPKWNFLEIHRDFKCIVHGAQSSSFDNFTGQGHNKEVSAILPHL